MEHYGLSQTEMARRLGVSKGQISHWISGRNVPSMESIARFLEVFPEINPQSFLAGKGPLFKPFGPASPPSLFDPPPETDKAPSSGTSEDKADHKGEETTGASRREEKDENEKRPLSGDVSKPPPSPPRMPNFTVSEPPSPSRQEKPVNLPASFNLGGTEQPLMVILLYPNNRFRVFYPGPSLEKTPDNE